MVSFQSLNKKIICQLTDVKTEKWSFEMDAWKLEQFEIIADAMEEVAEWDDYEADMADMLMEDYASMIPEEEEEEYEDYFEGNLEMDFNPYMGCYDYDC